MGATLGESWTASYFKGFNPRTRDGCDLTAMLFPSALYRFNPRTRDGCDDDDVFNALLSWFQSTHP